MYFITTKESFIFLSSFLVDMLTILVIWKKRQINGMHWLILAMVAVAVDNFFSILIASSVRIDQIIFLSKMEYLGASFPTPLLLLFFLSYPVNQAEKTPKLIATLLTIPILSILAVFTNDNHFLFWTGFHQVSGTLNSYYFSHGPFYWVFISYSYLCGLAIIFLIIKYMVQFPGIHRLQSFVMLISSISPIVAGILYSFKLTPLPGLDILPISFSISGLGIVISVVFLRLFDLLPISRNMLVENLQDGVIVVNDKKKIVDINPSAVKLFSPWELRVGDSIEKLEEIFPNEFLQTENSFEITISKPESRNFLITPNKMDNNFNSISGYIYIIRDITEMREVEFELCQSQERYRSLIDDVVDVSSIGIAIVDKDCNIAWVNQAIINSWESSREALIGIDIRELLRISFSTRIDDNSHILNKILESYIKGEYIENLEIHIQAKGDIPEKWLMYSSKPIQVGYYAGGRIAQFVNITEQKKLQAKIELLAITDELTGIYNRRGLFELGTHDFTRAHRTKTLISAIYLDIDRFKELNDRFGHAQGDQILTELVIRIQSQLRDMDIFARYGGDEFVILIPDANLDQALEISERIRKTIADTPFHVEESEYSLYSSIGVAQIKPEDDFSSLLDRADRCMYCSKQKGQNQVKSEMDIDQS